MEQIVSDNVRYPECIDVSHPSLFQQERWPPFFKKLREEDPIHFCVSSPYGPYWSITRYAEVKEIELDHETFSSALGGVRIDNGLRSGFLSSDPPQHTEQRKTVAPIAATENLLKYEVLIRERTANLISELPENEDFDWNDRVASELTIMMLSTMMDFPQADRRKLAQWSDTLLCDLTDPDAPVKTKNQRDAVLQKIGATFTTMIQDRASKSPRYDLLSMIAHSPTFNGIPHDQLIGSILLLITGGYDTTRNVISGGVLALSENPDQRQKLMEDPSLIPKAVSEMTRFQTPLIHMCRTATRDLLFHGKEIKAGDRIVLWYLSANRDETIMKDPDRFLIDREKPHKHLAFGAGIHHCVGERISNLQIRILLEELVNQHVEVDVVGEPTRIYSNFIRGFSKLPVRIRRR